VPVEPGWPTLNPLPGPVAELSPRLPNGLDEPDEPNWLAAVGEKGLAAKGGNLKAPDVALDEAEVGEAADSGSSGGKATGFSQGATASVGVAAGVGVGVRVALLSSVSACRTPDAHPHSWYSDVTPSQVPPFTASSVILRCRKTFPGAWQDAPDGHEDHSLQSLSSQSLGPQPQ